MPSNIGELKNFLVTVLVSVIPALLFTIYWFYLQRRKRKRFRDEYQKILLENEKMSDYLKYIISDDTLVRHQNNMVYFKNSNFDSELYERLSFLTND